MKNKILSLITALTLLIIPSVLLGIGIQALFGIYWWAIMAIGISVQWFYSYYAKKVKEYNLIKSSLEKYDALEYKKYVIPLTCQACGRENPVELDLTKTEFGCKFCQAKNAIYINFTTASITDPLYDTNDILANAT